MALSHQRISLTNHFKVVVVGGGPAGSSAARTLAAAGVEVCVIERGVFPRDKLCGGLLTLRSKKVFDTVFKADWTPVIQARSRGAEFFYNQKLLSSVADYKDVFFTCRRDYDALLLNLARASGAKVMLDAAVQSVNVANSSLALLDGREIRYDILIGADGVNSAVAKAVFGEAFRRETVGFGLEVELPFSPNIRPIGDPEIYFGLLKWGYGWVFPKRASLTVGVGGLWRANPRMKETLVGFLKTRFRHVPAAKIKGHFIPFGDFRRTPGRGNILLCGDAAGLVEPITGEGIAFAMLSGHYAAEGAQEAMRAGRGALALDYYAGRYAEIARIFQQANRLRHLLFPGISQYILSKLLPRSASIPRKQMDLMADEIGYDEFARFLLRKSVAGPVKVLFGRRKRRVLEGLER